VGAPTAEYEAYLRALRREIQDLLHYPASARRRGLSGTVRIEILLRPTGEIAEVTVLDSSSHAALDGAALEAVRALRPRPFPPHLPRRPLRVQLPVVFDLR
jgi:protein TonB